MRNTLLVALAVAAFVAAGCGTGTKGPRATVTVTATAQPSPTSSSSPSASPSPTAPPSPIAPPAFSVTIARIDPATRQAMLESGSWAPGDPVAISALRLLTLSYWGFDGAAHTGQLVVNASVAGDVARAMKALYVARFPIRRMRLVDAYGASDDRSMAADNTSAYNGRKVSGTTSWSMHAYGLAIDIDPLENPEVQNGKVYPPTGARYVDRSLHAKGMIHPDDAVVRAFAAIGWKWGGDWHSLKDYQHFSSNGL